MEHRPGIRIFGASTKSLYVLFLPDQEHEGCSFGNFDPPLNRSERGNSIHPAQRNHEQGPYHLGKFV